MEDHSATHYLQIPPRLRLSRQSLANSMSKGGQEADTQFEEEDDNSSTPRRAPLDVSAEQTPVASTSKAAFPETETPAARLRSLMSRVPNSATPRPAQPSAPSVHDSDFDELNEPNEPNEMSAPTQMSTSSAHASIRNVFTRALREPGDTPVKGRRRRSSIGSNAADESPIKARAKIGRKSLSDDELDRSFSHRESAATSEKSFKSTQAAVYDSLRARLSEVSFAGESTRGPLSAIPLPNGPASPPAATSTPLKHSVSTFPVQLSASNLMNDDSNMRRVMKALDSDTSTEGRLLDVLDNPSTGETPHAGIFQLEAKVGRNRERTLSRLSSSDSLNHSNSRPISRQGGAQSTNHTRELERGWNRPLSAYIDRHNFGSGDSLSNGHGRSDGLRRQGSAVSLRSSEASSHGRSSPSPSISSQSDRTCQSSSAHPYSSHAKEVGAGRREALHSNEAASHSRSSSTSPVQIRVGGRSRTLSHPVHPSSPAGRPRVDSVTSPAPRERPVSSLSHHRSSSSLHHNHTPSRASSSASSVTHDSAADIQHLRERNWNASHPNWSMHHEHHSHAHRRSQGNSPRPNSVNGHKRRDSSPSSSVSGNERVETSSSRTNGVQADSNVHDETSRHSSISRHASSTGLRPRASVRDHLHSPSHSSKLHDPAASTTAIASPRLPSRAKVGPSQDRTLTDKSSAKSTGAGHPSAHQHNQVDKAEFVSHIPVRSKIQAESQNVVPPVSTTNGDASYRASVAVDPIALHESDWESNDDDPAFNRSPHVQQQDADLDEVIVEKQESSIALQEHKITTALPDADVLPAASQEARPSTPKRNLYSASKLDFRPPPTPPDLPELPDPPTSSDEDSDATPRTPLTINRGSNVDAKTPRPPGAWLTPAPVKAEVIPTDVTISPFEAHNALYTPPASLSRATSLPLRTPAPPGAWTTTPAICDKKRAQKVRFGESSAADNKQVDEDEDVQKPQASQSLDQTSSFLQNSSSSIPAGISNGSERSPRRLSSIRVVDAFGKEISGREDFGSSDASVNPFDSDGLQRSPSSRRTTRIRVVDALGKAFDDENSRAGADDEIRAMVKGIEERNMNNQQARDLIAKTIADLKSDVDRFPLALNSPDTIDDRVAALNEQIHSGSEKRRKLQDALANAQKIPIPATHEPKAKLSSKVHRWLPTPSKVFAICVVIQLLIGILLYRIMSIAALNAFLTTYIDPFNPELYLHITNPEIFRTLSDSPDHAGRRIDWTRYAFRTLHNFVDHFLSVQDVWYPWSNPSRSVAWPPT